MTSFLMQLKRKYGIKVTKQIDDTGNFDYYLLSEYNLDGKCVRADRFYDLDELILYVLKYKNRRK